MECQKRTPINSLALACGSAARRKMQKDGSFYPDRVQRRRFTVSSYSGQKEMTPNHGNHFLRHVLMLLKKINK